MSSKNADNKPGMVECPKCGFHQPPDRFCASCGVDMHSFKPKASAWSNAYLQFFAVALVVVSALFFVHRKAKERIEQRTEVLTNVEESFASENRAANEPTESGQFATTESVMANPSADRERPRQPQAPRQFKASTTTAKPIATNTSTATTSAEASAGKTQTPPQIRVTFAEVPRFYIDQILQKSRAVTGYGNQQVAVVPKIKTVVSDGRTASQINVLAQSKSEDLVANKTVSIFEGYIDEELDQKIGFTIQVTPTAFEGEAIDLQVEILRETKDYHDNEVVTSSQPFQENFRLNGEAGALMTGTLNVPQQIAEDDRSVIAGTIFKIYNSEAFQEAQSDFVLFFEVLRN